MKAFICHNKADKVTARMIASALVQQGVDVWFDEWKIRPGESITGGIEAGLTDANCFVLVWSQHASKSNWVGTELRAYLRRRVDDQTLRIVPFMLDETPLPALVADYKGFKIDPATPIEDIAQEITGNPSDVQVAQLIQTRLIHLMQRKSKKGDPLPYLACPQCASTKLHRDIRFSSTDDEYYVIQCDDCGWYDWTQ
jgi:TIR domain